MLPVVSMADKSLTYNMKSLVPSNDPCGTPISIGNVLDLSPLMTTNCLMFERYEDSQSWKAPDIPAVSFSLISTHHDLWYRRPFQVDEKNTDSEAIINCFFPSLIEEEVERFCRNTFLERPLVWVDKFSVSSMIIG